MNRAAVRASRLLGRSWRSNCMRSSACRYLQDSASLDADTVYACSTGKGKYGVQIHRVSGEGASLVGSRLLRQWPKIHASPGLLVPTSILCPSSQPGTSGLQAIEVLDRGMAVFFASPRSYTGEDVVEIHSHGSIAVREAIEEAIQGCSSLVSRSTSGSVRLAQPGEFSKRALAMGKLDLTRAEGLGSLLAADTAAQRRSAMRLVEGALERQGVAWLNGVIRALAMAEALLDFGEEEADVNESSAHGELVQLVVSVSDQMALSLRATQAVSARSSMYSAPSVVLAGAPNAGKSSLFNALLQRDASIVTSEAGTTRDAVEAHVEIGGVGSRLLDTAGVRGTGPRQNFPANDCVAGTPAVGPIEAEGIRRAVAAAGRAAILVLVADARDVMLSVAADGEANRSAKGGEWKNSLVSCAAERTLLSPDTSCAQGVVLVLSKADLLENRSSGSLSTGTVDALLQEMRQEWERACRDAIRANASDPGASRSDGFESLQTTDTALPAAVHVLGMASTSVLQPGGVAKLAELLASIHSEFEAGPSAVSTESGDGRGGLDGANLLLRERHREAVRLALEHLLAARRLLGADCHELSSDGDPGDDLIEKALLLGGAQGDLVSVAEHLRGCAARLGELLGRVDSEQVLDVVFREFCIGK